MRAPLPETKVLIERAKCATATAHEIHDSLRRTMQELRRKRAQEGREAADGAKEVSLPELRTE